MDSINSFIFETYIMRGSVRVETFEEYLSTIKDEEKRGKVRTILNWVKEKYPNFTEEVKWSQPMFSNEGTYIIGFNATKKHLSVSPEKAGIAMFEDELKEKGYNPTSMTYRVPWNKGMDYELLKRVIDFQTEDKKGYERYWRKP